MKPESSRRFSSGPVNRDSFADTPGARAMDLRGTRAIAQGMSPDEAVAPVIDGIRCGTFLIPTRPSYAEQLRHRCEALRAREQPALTEVD